LYRSTHRKLIRQYEHTWDADGLQGLGRENRRREVAEIYRAHIEAGELYYPDVDYASSGVPITAGWFWSWNLDN
jgi:hypothetical protein